jgi:lauroyl/myristoyl acyltransferase
MAAVVAARSRTPVTGPMETLPDPELQRVIFELRARAGARIIALPGAGRALRTALARGESVGVVGDRPISGPGLPIPLFDLPATLPIGAAHLALDAGAPFHVGAIRRVGRSGFRGRLVTLAHPDPGLSRRSRVEALLTTQAAVFEDLIAAAPDQWWAVFYPIWDAVGPLSRGTARERARARAAA